MNDNVPVWMAVLVSFVMIVLTLSFWSGVKNREWHDRAVKAGHAEFYLDKDNNRQWRWLPLDKKGAKREDSH